METIKGITSLEGGRATFDVSKGFGPIIDT